MPSRNLTLPFKMDYHIIFHESELFKFCLDAKVDSLSILLVSQVDGKMWKGDFPSEYLEDISRRTGREMTYL